MNSELNKHIIARPILSGEIRVGENLTEIFQQGRKIGGYCATTEQEKHLAFSNAQRELELWSHLSVKDRIDQLKKYRSILLENKQQLAELYCTEAELDEAQTEKQFQDAIMMMDYQMNCAVDKISNEIEMPGPTGESNIFYTSARGIFISLLEKPSLIALIGQITAALVTGNTLMVCPQKHLPLLQYKLSELALLSNLPRALIQYLPGEALVDELFQSNLTFAGVVFTGDFARAKKIQQALACKKGAIAKLILETDAKHFSQMNQSDYILQFVTERTRTVNTAAVGGNASLLELETC